MARNGTRRHRPPLKIVDLFAGAGGLSEGFRQAGWQVLAGVDFDPDACATYKRNFADAESIHGDLRERRTRAKLNNLGSVDVVVGGPPCQAFSQVRNHARLIEDPRNSLYSEFVRIVGRLEPKAFVMENVPGLEQMGVKEQVLEDLSLRGKYRVTAQAVDAADFGVPQTRRRIAFIGIHSDLNAAPPILQGSDATSLFTLTRRNGGRNVRYEVIPRMELFAQLERLQDPNDSAFVTASQAIGDLAMLQVGERREEMDVADMLPASSDYQRRMRKGLNGVVRNTSVPRINADTRIRLSELPPGGNVHDLPEELTGRYLTGELWGPSNGTGRLGRRHYYAYRRLHPDLWSWTLNTKGDSVYHYGEARALSVREFARLQSFPDAFVFTTDPRPGALPGRIQGGAAHSKYRQVGNAVPPLLACAIAIALEQALRG